jgi:hypothetical protein
MHQNRRQDFGYRTSQGNQGKEKVEEDQVQSGKGVLFVTLPHVLSDEEAMALRCDCGAPCDCYSWTTLVSIAKRILPFARENAEAEKIANDFLCQNKDWFNLLDPRIGEAGAIIRALLEERK